MTYFLASLAVLAALAGLYALLARPVLNVDGVIGAGTRTAVRALPCRPGLSPAFDLSRWSYYLDFVLVPIVVCALVVISPLDARSGLSAIAGFLVWTFAEYWIHRLVLHGPTPFEPMHEMHHRLPKDLIGVASWGTFAGFALVFAVSTAAFTAGFMLGYLAYCAIHVRMHHGDRRRFSRYVKFMFEHHAGHHRGGRGNFGVSVPIWDFIFATYRKA